MIEEIKLNGLDNKPIKTTKKPPPKALMKIYHHVILHLSLSVVKALVKLIH
jgi:hypothetical protein